MPEEFITPQPSNEMSMSDTFVGILSSPGEVYQTIVDTEPRTSNWAVPMVIAMVIGILFTMIVFTQPAIQDQMAAAQLKAMQNRVAEGKMTQEQLDQAMERNPAKPGSPMFLVFGSIGVVVVVAFSAFAYSAVYFLAGKLILKTTASYTKVLEVFGLSFYVAAVGSVLTIILVVAMGSIHASLSPTLFIGEFDPFNRTHKFLSALNLLEFWAMFVVGVGLSKVWKTTMVKALSVVGGVWLVWTLVKVFANFGFGG